jgi:hypothetical protein
VVSLKCEELVLDLMGEEGRAGGSNREELASRVLSTIESADSCSSSPALGTCYLLSSVPDPN